MNLVQQALAASGRANPADARAAAPRRAIVAGAGGALGSAIVEHLLARRRFASVSVLVTQPLQPGLQGLRPLPVDALRAPPADDGAAEDTALVVFDCARHANGRERAFLRPEPAELPALAAALHARGVRRLVLVMPHAPGLLPNALKQGLAGLDEHAVVALGFEQVLILRSAQQSAAARADSWLQRLANLVLAQLHFVVPARDQPVRAAKVAAFTAALAEALAEAPAGTRVVPPEWVWEAAQSSDVDAVARHWLAGDAALQTAAPPDWLRLRRGRGRRPA